MDIQANKSSVSRPTFFYQSRLFYQVPCLEREREESSVWDLGKMALESFHSLLISAEEEMNTE